MLWRLLKSIFISRISGEPYLKIFIQNCSDADKGRDYIKEAKTPGPLSILRLWCRDPLDDNQGPMSILSKTPPTVGWHPNKNLPFGFAFIKSHKARDFYLNIIKPRRQRVSHTYHRPGWIKPLYLELAEYIVWSCKRRFAKISQSSRRLLPGDITREAWLR